MNQDSQQLDESGGLTVPRGARRGSRRWTWVALAAALPLLLTVCGMLWTVPYTLTEAVATFADASERSVTSFFVPTSSYYRPIFFVTISALWHVNASLDGALSAIRLVHILPAAILILLLVWHLRPRSLLDAGVAVLAVNVLVGSPGFTDNLELPLSYTIVGMAAALLAWIILEREHRLWHGPVIVALTVVAIGFKEQGLVLVPIVMVAWWAGARGVGRVTVATVGIIGVAYVLFRLGMHDPSLPRFEQDIGFGFGSLSPGEADARFGAFPLWIYAYNGASTILNVLFAEPTGGVFRIVRALMDGVPAPWHAVHLFSSSCLTALIAVWGSRALASTRRATWTPEARLWLVTAVVVLANGALSFNYSRDRLGGMAVVFYALAAYPAVRATVSYAARAPVPVAAAVAVLLLTLAGTWQIRALYTIEFTRDRAVSVQRDWMTSLTVHRVEVAGRTEYLRIIEEMVPQGTDPSGKQYTPYPRWVRSLLGPL